MSDGIMARALRPEETGPKKQQKEASSRAAPDARERIPTAASDKAARSFVFRCRHGDPARELAILIARRYGGMSLREIGQAVGDLQYPAVSDAARRISARLETDRALEKTFRRLGKILKLLGNVAALCPECGRLFVV